ncbi:MAG: LytR C-terminal domain-containing protein [Cellulomonadaceae bacterium]
MTRPTESPSGGYRRREHERQAVVFGLLIAFLGLSGLGALAVYSGALSLPGSAEFVVPTSTQDSIVQAQACVPADTFPVPYNEVNVTVLNGSDRAGLAGAVGDALAQRGFTLIGTGNDTRRPATGLISFGLPGIGAAYTLLAHYPEARLVLDARTDASVDLTVPESFDDLIETDLVALDPEQTLVSVADCEDPATITPQPAPARLTETADPEAPAEDEAPAEG